MSGVIMCVFVAYAMLQLLRTAVMAVLQMRWNGTNPNIPHIAQRLVNPKIGGIAFRRTGNVCHRLRQGHPPLRHPDKIDRLHGRNRHLQRVRICIAHILWCTDHNSSRYKLHIFSCIQHLCKIKDRCIRVWAAHALNKCRDNIVMVISFFVIIHHSFLDTFWRNIQSNMNLSIFASVRCQYTQFNRIQCVSCISTWHICQKFKCIIFYHCMKASKTFLSIIHCTEKQFLNICLLQWMQFKNTWSRNQSSIYLKIRILRCCANQDQRSIFHKWKQIILLPFIKAMNFINKKNRLFSIHSLQIFCFFHYFFHIFLSGNCRIDLFELCAGCMCDHLCQCCLSCSRRSVKNQRTQLICLNCPVKQFIFSYDMLLSHYFIQCHRTHPGCKRGFLLFICLSHIIK